MRRCSCSSTAHIHSHLPSARPVQHDRKDCARHRVQPRCVWGWGSRSARRPCVFTSHAPASEAQKGGTDSQPSTGLGLALVKALVSRGLTVFATVRSPPADGTFPDGVKVISGVDLTSDGGGADALEKGLGGAKLDLVLISAGLLHGDVSPFSVGESRY